MAALKDDVKTFIVQQLACFDTPSVVAEAVKAEFGLSVTRQQVEAYDPSKVSAARLGDKWKVIFEETRKAFLDDTSSIGISHKAVRLRALNRMAAKAEGIGNMALAAQLMEQAAKECGDAFTNKVRKELSGPNGAAIPVANLSPDEWKGIAREVADEV